MVKEHPNEVNHRLEVIRQRIEHEHDLINQRLSWLVSSQAFLLTAFAISLNAPQAFVRDGYADANRLLTRCIPMAAIACVVVLAFTLIGAIWSLEVLRRQAEARSGPLALPVLNIAPIRWLGMAAPIFIPIIFLTLWILLLTYI